MSHLLKNPYHYCGAVIARLAVSVATAIWSLVILSKTNALGPTTYGPTLTELAPENVYGGFFLALAVGLIYRLCRPSKPHWLGIVSYGILFFKWMFILAFICFNDGPIWPTTLSTVVVIAVLALYAFLAMPKRMVVNCAARD